MEDREGHPLLRWKSGQMFRTMLSTSHVWASPSVSTWPLTTSQPCRSYQGEICYINIKHYFVKSVTNNFKVQQSDTAKKKKKIRPYQSSVNQKFTGNISLRKSEVKSGVVFLQH